MILSMLTDVEFARLPSLTILKRVAWVVLMAKSLVVCMALVEVHKGAVTVPATVHVELP
jgi:hypothetical protein